MGYELSQAGEPLNLHSSPEVNERPGGPQNCMGLGKTVGGSGFRDGHGLAINS